MAAWESTKAGLFTLTALPASGGVGDPQVAWLVGSSASAPRWRS